MRVKILVSIGLLLVLILSAAPVYAIPALPHAFCGTVTINKDPAPNGTQISATVAEGEVLTTSQNPIATVNNNYGIDGLPLLVQGEGLSGAITFYVNGVKVEGVTATFEASGGPTLRDLSVTIAAPEPEPEPEPTPTVGGGGGAGPEITRVSLTGLTAWPSLRVDADGTVQSTCCLTSSDGKLTLDIAEGAILLDSEGDQLTVLSASTKPSPPEAPEDKVMVTAYNLGPDGATFSPAITLTIEYNPETLPEGYAEKNLYIAYWDGSEWSSLTTTVNAEADTVSCPLSHFTIFAIIGAVTPPPAPAPAVFSVSNLSIQPAQVELKEPVTITVSVANTGGTVGIYSVVLKINGVKEAKKSVTVAAGSSEEVSFSVTREEVDSYSVTVDGLSGSFTVVAPPLPVPAPPEVKPPINWPLIGGIIGGVVVVGLLVYFLVIRRRFMW